MKTKVTTEVKVNIESEETQILDDKVTPKGKGKLDMVIAFDTTGSMAAYIDDVRNQMAESRAYPGIPGEPASLS